MIREARNDEKIETAEFVYRFIFMAGEHNYLCAVCRDNKAVLESHNGILQPCWKCQGDGYFLTKRNGFWNWFRKTYL